MALTLRELMSKQFPAQSFLIGDGLLRRGSIMVIGGQPKSFKSFITNSIIYQLVLGGSLFETPPSNRAGRDIPRFVCPGNEKVLFIEQELGEEDLRERLGDFVQLLPEGPEKNKLLDSIYIESGNHELQLDKPSGIQKISALIETVKPTVVCFDPLVEFHTSDENDQAAMTKILRTIDNLRERYRFTTIITHHHKKPSGDQSGARGRGGDQLRGSSTLFGKVDTILSLELSNEKARIVRINPTIRRGKPIPEFFVQLQNHDKLFHFKNWFSTKNAVAVSKEKAEEQD